MKTTMMKKLGVAAFVATLALGSAGCQDFLDVNTNPNAPQSVSPNLYLAPMIHWMATGEQYDGRYIGRYSQEWFVPQTSGTTPETFALHGYAAGSDAPAEIWRDAYWMLGMNLSDEIRLAEEAERWDAAGVGYTLRAWGWLSATQEHGDIIVSQAFTPDQYYFDYDNQEAVYKEIIRLLDKAIENLQRTDGKISPTYLAVGDKLFNGNAQKWLKLAYGFKARALSNFCPNKTTCDPDAIIAAVDASFASSAEDALFTYPGTATDNGDRNFWGTTRANLGSYRPSAFFVGLMNGTQYPGAVDPRMSRMISPDSTGTYRGIELQTGYPALTKERPWNLWGVYGTGLPPADNPGKYLFSDRNKFPIMTYAQLQFIKAEAALKKGDQGTAKTAYLNGINAHFDFVNARTQEVSNPNVLPITAAERAAFLANPSINPPVLTLSHVMGQKFIAQWAWAHLEGWMDLRRYHYTDLDPVSGTQVFRNFNLPTTYFADNNNKPVQRVRPRYNSDYVWNRVGLAKIGGLDLDYHTKPLWITER